MEVGAHAWVQMPDPVLYVYSHTLTLQVQGTYRQNHYQSLLMRNNVITLYVTHWMLCDLACPGNIAEEFITSRNIRSFEGCTEIEGAIKIFSGTLGGYLMLFMSQFATLLNLYPMLLLLLLLLMMMMMMMMVDG